MANFGSVSVPSAAPEPVPARPGSPGRSGVVSAADVATQVDGVAVPPAWVLPSRPVAPPAVHPSAGVSLPGASRQGAPRRQRATPEAEFGAPGAAPAETVIVTPAAPDPTGALRGMLPDRVRARRRPTRRSVASGSVAARLPDPERLVVVAVVVLGAVILALAWWRSGFPATDPAAAAHPATGRHGRTAPRTTAPPTLTGGDSAAGDANTSDAAPGGGAPSAGTADSGFAPDAAPGSALRAAVPGMWRVQVGGAVLRPGVYSVPKGARVEDAIAAAGGPAPGIDATRINLAARLADGAAVHLPGPDEAVPVAAGVATPDADAAPPPVDLNAATVAELDALPGVGHATAEAIVKWRDAHGPFRTPADLDRVPGLGPGKIARLADRVTV